MAMDVDSLTVDLTVTHDTKATPSEDAVDSPMEDVGDPVPTTTTPTVFHKFRTLPAELRNCILDHALVESTALKAKKRDSVKKDAMDAHDSGNEDASVLDQADDAAEQSVANARSIHACVLQAADSNILLVDQQMNYEYKARANLAMTLELTDHQDYAFTPFIVPEAMKNIYVVVFHIILFCHDCPMASHASAFSCHATMELFQHYSWIKKVLAQMTTLRQVSVYAHICHDKYKLAGKKRPPCEPIVKQKIKELQLLDKMSHLVLYRYDHDQKSNLVGPKETIYEWEDGEVKEVKEPPKKEEPKEEDEEEAKDVEMPDSPSFVADEQDG